MLSNYGLKSSYLSRTQPAYFNDTLPDSTAWQADVYRLAALLARRAGVTRLIDLGCGRGAKLAPYADEFQITGIDYGANIEQCQKAYAAGEWITANLNTEELPAERFQDAVVICADVIEHLPTPDALIRTLRNASQTARYVLVSTPDRERVYGAALHGEPNNPYHVREWTNLELVTWFKSEKLPAVWWGWTVSNDAHPDQRWTSLVVLSKKDVVENIPASYENNGGIVHRNPPPRSAGDKLKVWMTPTPQEAGRDITNSINHIVVYLQEHLQKYDVELVEQPDNADLRAGHAGQGSTLPLDVAHYHGLYPTAQWENPGSYFSINASVIRNLKTAKAITAPSQWIADVIRRDMHVNPQVIGWGVNTDEWTPADNPHVYVLWNKARVDPVCNPTPMLQLAARAHDTLFLTTFGEGTPNVKTIGRQPYEVMKGHVRNAGVYLSLNVETFGIGVLEAMASGVPVLGWRLDNTAQLVEHGVTGFLAEPGDMDGLYEGLRYCLKHRKTLGVNAREAAKQYSWDRVAREFAALYRRVLEPNRSGVKVSVVIPCHNYDAYLAEAIESVLAQQADFAFEIIVVLDNCTDNSEAIARSYASRGVKAIVVQNGNLSATRNDGIEIAQGEFICCLDADDRMGSPMFLQALADALSSDPLMGIAFTSIQFMDSEGKLGHKSTWPNGYDFEKQLHRFNQVPSCCLFRKEAWRRAGGFKPHFVYAQDAEFWTQVGLLGYSAKHVIEDGWFHYRLHNKSQSQVHRTGEVPEPDWTEYYPASRDNERPFASDGKAPYGSWPVRFYHEPDVSVIIPVGKGHEKAVRDALHSVEGQTHRYWECIVVNDTGKALCLEGFPWAKVIETTGSIGAGAARNAGAKIARAPFLVFLDADDMLKPEFIAKTLKAYRQFGRYAYTDWLTHDKQTNWQVHETPNYSFSAIWERPSIHPVTALIPRLWFQRVGGFDESLPSMEDVDLYMKFLTHGYCGVRVNEPLLIYNLSSGQRRASGEARKDEFKALMVERYGAYMRGETMCNCVEPPKGKSPQPPSLENAADYHEQYGDMVKVQYTWEFAPEGPAPLRGVATHVQYGRRAKGEIFYIWQKDYENMPGMFTRIETYVAEPMPTIVPPEPTPLVAVMPGLDSMIVAGDAPVAAPAEMPVRIDEQAVTEAMRGAVGVLPAAAPLTASDFHEGQTVLYDRGSEQEPVRATVVAVTTKRVKISFHDPALKEDVERTVTPEKLSIAQSAAA